MSEVPVNNIYQNIDISELLEKVAKVISDFEDKHDNAITVGGYLQFYKEQLSLPFDWKYGVYEYNGLEFQLSEHLEISIKENEE